MKCEYCVDGRVQLFSSDEACEYCGGTGVQKTCYGPDTVLIFIANSGEMVIPVKDLLAAKVVLNSDGDESFVNKGEVNDQNCVLLYFEFEAKRKLVVNRYPTAYVRYPLKPTGFHSQELAMSSEMQMRAGDILKLDWKLKLAGGKLAPGLLSGV